MHLEHLNAKKTSTYALLRRQGEDDRRRLSTALDKVWRFWSLSEGLCAFAFEAFAPAAGPEPPNTLTVGTSFSCIGPERPGQRWSKIIKDDIILGSLGILVWS